MHRDLVIPQVSRWASVDFVWWSGYGEIYEINVGTEVRYGDILKQNVSEYA